LVGVLATYEWETHWPSIVFCRRGDGSADAAAETFPVGKKPVLASAHRRAHGRSSPMPRRSGRSKWQLPGGRIRPPPFRRLVFAVTGERIGARRVHNRTLW